MLSLRESQEKHLPEVTMITSRIIRNVSTVTLKDLRGGGLLNLVKRLGEKIF